MGALPIFVNANGQVISDRRPVELYNAVNAAALNVAGITKFQVQFPLGEGWYAMNLRILLSLTIGSGSGALAQAMARILTNVLLTTDRDGIIVNAPGRMLFQRAYDILGTSPQIFVAFAAATATYDISIPIIFADPRMYRPEDTILNTNRYNQVELSLSMGSVANLLGTVGSSSYTATVSIDLVRSKGLLGPTMQPILYPFIASKQTVDPNVVQTIQMERAIDLAVKRIYLFASDNSGAWQGTADDAVIALATLLDQTGFVGWNNEIDAMIQAGNKEQYGLETYQAGRYVMDYPSHAGSTASCEYTGDKSRYDVTWTNDTPTSRFVHSGIDGVRTFKSATPG